MTSAPYSVDPLDYDAFVHHITFRSVYSSLITQYKLGSYTGILASSWKSENNSKTWTFEIRPNLTFENGDSITPKAIALSLNRLAYVLKQKGSSSEVLDNLLGFAQINSPMTIIEGIGFDDTQLILNFVKPVPKVLDVISFGIYGITHQSNFDPKTGAWKDPKQIIASGPYKLKSWTQSEIQLEKRDQFISEIGHPRQFKQITINWDKNLRNQSDLVMGDSIVSDLSKHYHFFGGANSSIAYVRCRSWTVSGSPCADKTYRQLMRERFYDEMEKLGFHITRSFFPLAIKSVKELPKIEVKDTALLKKPAKFAISKTANPVFQGFNTAIEAAGDSVGVKFTKVDVPRATWMHEYEQNLPGYLADFYMLSTGILLEDPMQDIKFMFFSKEGVRFPDATGIIKSELKLDTPDVQRINQELWDQAVIWPVTHYSSGFWSRGGIDFSLLNLSLPPSDFQWLGELD